MNKNITVLPGDGIGPEVIAQAVKVLDAVADRFDHKFTYCYGDIGAAAIDLTGDPLPMETLEACLNADAVLFGAIGHPKFDNNPDAKVRPEQGLLRMRKAMQLFCNIRPVKVYPGLAHLSPLREERVRGIDLVIYRELTGGIYFGEKGYREDGTAYDICAYHEIEIERIARPAFEMARQRRKHLTLVDKANVLESSRLWRKVVTKIAADYPDVTFDCMYVDNAAMQLIQWPAKFDVILTSNMFGDILSDAASVLPGSMGLLPSSSVGDELALFEPIHGSWPEAAGKNRANPMAIVLSAAMMLDHFGLVKEASIVRKAVDSCLNGGVGTEDLHPQHTYSCSQIGDLLSSIVADESVGLKVERIKAGMSTII